MKKRFGKRFAAMLISLLTLLMAFGGCADSASGGSSTQTAEGKTEILFWHSMSGANQEVLNKIVDGFNASQDEYVVVAENQGSYDESTGKFFNMANGAGSAHIIPVSYTHLRIRGWRRILEAWMVFQSGG